MSQATAETQMESIKCLEQEGSAIKISSEVINPFSPQVLLLHLDSLAGVLYLINPDGYGRTQDPGQA